MRILAVSGSLRRDSTNTRLLRAAALLAPSDATIDLYADLGSLPHFNPDLDEDEPPPLVSRLREAVGAHDALLICSPEYAHGVPGTLKNALDWLVASREMVGMLVVLLNASARAVHAQAQLAETLRTMSTEVVEATIGMDGRRIDEHAIANDPDLAAALQDVLTTIRARLGRRARSMTAV